MKRNKNTLLDGRERPLMHRSGQCSFSPIPCETKRDNEWRSFFGFIAVMYMLEMEEDI